MGGPEYLSMIAGEAKEPRRTVPKAFKTLMKRLMLFFVGGAVCVGILLPSNDSTLLGGSDTYAGGCPYVISMENVKIKVLPSIINACLIIVILSAGNAFTFNATRSLHALALDGKAPRVLTSLSRHGVPYTCCIVVMFLTCLSYLAIAVIFQGRLELDPQFLYCSHHVQLVRDGHHLDPLQRRH